MLSLSKGIVHPYYVSALGPGVAAMVGAGAYAFAEFASRRRLAPAAARVAAAAATVAAQLVLLHRDDYMSWFTRAADRRRGGRCWLLVGRRARLRPLGAAPAPPAIALLLGAAARSPRPCYSASNWLAPVQSTFPAAGPRAAAGPGGYGVNPSTSPVDRALLAYVESHGAGARWSVLGRRRRNTASPMILLGGRAGRSAASAAPTRRSTAPASARLVRAGEARYVVLGGEFSTRGGNARDARRAARLPRRHARASGCRGRSSPTA